jgi:hypothetical protein
MTPTATQLAQMRVAHADEMGDTCVLQTYSSASQDAVGAPVATYTDGSALACGFDMTGGREVPRADLTVAVSAAVVRLPSTTDVDLRDRVKLTHRHGTALTTPIVYGIIGVRRGPTATLLDLEAVTT